MEGPLLSRTGAVKTASFQSDTRLACSSFSTEIVSLDSYDSEGPHTPETDESAGVKLKHTALLYLHTVSVHFTGRADLVLMSPEVHLSTSPLEQFIMEKSSTSTIKYFIFWQINYEFNSMLLINYGYTLSYLS